MKIILAGLSHKTSPVEIREKFFLRPLERGLLLSQLKSEPGVVEAFVLSTCNRTEIYASLIHDDPAVLMDSLFKVKGLYRSPELFQNFYVKRDRDVVRHLFRVACGLDSLVIGEKQILGQLKEAMALAKTRGMFYKMFNILTNLAIRAGKIAHTQTPIAYGGSSVSWAAVAMAQKMLGSLQGKNVLIIGAGKMSQLTAAQLARKELGQVFVLNRTPEKASDLAKQIGGQAVSFWNMKEILSQVDVCICSSGAPHYLVDYDLVEMVSSSRSKPLLFVDISTPRNVDPRVSLVPGIRVVSIDDLQKVVDENMEKRHSAIEEVEEIVRTKIAGFYEKISKIHQFEKELTGQTV